MNEVGVSHTKTQVQKIRRKGVEILSYFICSSENDQLKNNFYKMYGSSSKFIDVENIVDLAKTMNNLFLTKTNEKTS
jgi:hypothetical protein